VATCHQPWWDRAKAPDGTAAGPASASTVRTRTDEEIRFHIEMETEMRAFQLRLRERGKPPKVALIACAHELPTILNSMVRTGEPWRLDRA